MLIPWYVLLVSYLCVTYAQKSGKDPMQGSLKDALKSIYEDDITPDRITDPYISLLSDFWKWRLSDVPEFATTVGVHDYDDRLESFTVEECRQREKSCSDFIRRIDDIDSNLLTGDQKDNLELLRYDLHTMVEGYTYRRFGFYNPINKLEGVHRDVSLWVDAMPFSTVQHYRVYETRLMALATQINEQTSLMKEAIRLETTINRVSLEKVAIDIDELLKMPIKTWDLYKPYRNDTIQGLDKVTNTFQITLQDDGYNVIEDHVWPAYRILRKFILNQYLPRSRASITVSSLVGGFEYYRARIKWYLSENVSPYILYMRGQDAILEVMKKIEQVKGSVGYIGKLAEFLRYAQGAGKFFFTTEDEQLQEYRRIVNEKIPLGLAYIFKNISIPAFSIQSMPFDGPEAVMMPGSDEMPGVFFVNVKNPFERPKWKMKAIALRETLPGRLYQSTVESKLPLPNFRRHREYRKLYSIPFQYPFHSAYTEGWYLYAESLGHDMNLYLNPYDQLGQLFSELHHLALMVTDTGIHSLSWSRKYAIDYLHKVTGIGTAQAEQEVDRIITLPGQATAPAYGYIKIKELKDKAMKRFGTYFDIKEFHDEVLRCGTVPLYFLEMKINKWMGENAPEYKLMASTNNNNNIIKDSTSTSVLISTVCLCILYGINW